jgi:hypothetical protein
MFQVRKKLGWPSYGSLEDVLLCMRFNIERGGHPCLLVARVTYGSRITQFVEANRIIAYLLEDDANDVT